jgi:hypothetical protein
MTEDNEQQSPFTRGGFVAAAVVVALIVVLGIVIVIVNATRDDPEPTPTTSTSAEPTTAPTAEPTSELTEVAGGASVCGLPGEVTETARLTSAPTVDEWAYQGTVAYPVSAQYGPAATDEAGGFRYCFQRSPEGAVFAAVNAVVQGADFETMGAWLDYFLANGPHRDTVLSQDAGTSTADQGVRIEIAGFRLLAYDGQTARVDVAVRGATGGQTVNLSMVYLLAWEAGDWKLSVTDPNAPINVANIPDLAGYISWGE